MKLLVFELFSCFISYFILIYLLNLFAWKCNYIPILLFLFTIEVSPIAIKVKEKAMSKTEMSVCTLNVLSIRLKNCFIKKKMNWFSEIFQFFHQERIELIFRSANWGSIRWTWIRTRRTLSSRWSRTPSWSSTPSSRPLNVGSNVTMCLLFCSIRQKSPKKTER